MKISLYHNATTTNLVILFCGSKTQAFVVKWKYPNDQNVHLFYKTKVLITEKWNRCQDGAFSAWSMGCFAVSVVLKLLKCVPVCIYSLKSCWIDLQNFREIFIKVYGLSLITNPSVMVLTLWTWRINSFHIDMCIDPPHAHTCVCMCVLLKVSKQWN